MPVPSPNILLALIIVSFSLSAIFHHSTTQQTHPPGSSNPPTSVFSHYAADIFVPSTNDTFSSRPAAFGGVFDDIVEGELVKAWGDGNACKNPIEGAEDGEWEGKIVLVRRGECSFADKVRRVQRMGGKAVVVGDNTAGTGPLTMYAKGDTSDIVIPSTFISHASYLSLSFLLSLPPPLEVVISPSTASDWPLLDTLLLVVLSPLFTLACIYILLILRRRVARRRELAPISVVNSLPHRTWTREKDEQEHIDGETSTPPTGATGGTGRAGEAGYGTRMRRVHILECVVCLDDFVEGDIVITLPCDHEFHEACITPWLTTRRRLCPICKRDITTTSEDPVVEADERAPLLDHLDSPVRTHTSEDWRGETAGSP